MDIDNRLISAEWLKSKFYEICEECNSSVIFIDRIIDEIDEAPDVEVVRCKDCKKWHRHTEVDRERGECRRYQTTKHETGFCDRGERKNNED